MKKLLSVLLSVALMHVLSADLHAGEYDHVVISISSSICLPVKVVTDKGTFSVQSRNVTLRAGRVNEAYDCRGNLIIKTEKRNVKSPGDDFYSYSFTGTYSSTSSSRSSSRNYSSRSSGSNSAAYGLGQALGMGLASLGSGWDDECHRLDVAAGYGYSYGGIGVAVNYQAPVVFGASFGIGRNPNYGEWREDNVVGIYFGLQMWITSHWNFEMGGGNCFMDGESGLTVATNLQFPILDRLGIRAGIGGALPFVDDPDACLMWNVGIVWRLVALEW